MSEDGNNPALDVEPTPAIPADGTPNPMTPGAQMAQQRMALGWTVSEVAAQLNLAPRQIVAIEDDNHAALPGVAITRGFIRAYAKLLRLDSTPLVASLVTPPESGGDTMPARRAMAPTHFSDNRMSSASGHRAASKWYSALLLAVVVIAAGSAAQHYGWLPHDLETASAKVSTGLTSLRGNETAAATATAPAATSEQSAQPSTEPSPGHVEITPAMPIVTMPAPVVVAPAAVPVAPVAVAPAASATIPPVNLALVPPTAAGTDNKLVLNVRSDSWIEIRGGKGAVASKLYRAGSTETFDIVAPSVLVVGNAAGVDATLRGAPLVLQSATNNNVARINLK